jgi:hypothetical protein
MAWTAKLTIARGKVQLKDVAITAGTAEAAHDVMSLNMDVAVLTKGEALIMLENLADKIHASPWPPL